MYAHVDINEEDCYYFTECSPADVRMRLADDGCPLAARPFTSYVECGECGSMWCGCWRENYTTFFECPDCGGEGHNYDEDGYGCMSVPWGFNL